MTKEVKIIKCVYCGKGKETTRDHVISKNLFPKLYQKKNLIIVPSCADCNKSFSLDEEYFRNFVCGLTLERSQYAKELFFSTIKRSIQRKPQIGFRAMRQMELVNLYTKSGIYLGKRTKIHITEDDWTRYFNVLNKYIKGLFSREFREILPSNYRIKHFWGREKLLENLKHINKWNLDNKEIFAYGYNFIPDTYKSIWATIFYDSIFFITFIATDQDFEYFNKSKT